MASGTSSANAEVDAVVAGGSAMGVCGKDRKLGAADKDGERGRAARARQEMK